MSYQEDSQDETIPQQQLEDEVEPADALAEIPEERWRGQVQTELSTLISPHEEWLGPRTQTPIPASISPDSLALLLAQEQPKPPYSRRIFANRQLRLGRIDWIGFDMDYTILRYAAKPMDELSYNQGLKQLVALGYNEEILDFQYDPQRAMRGLLIDKEQGNLIQINRHRHVGAAYHGHQALDKTVRKQIYRRSAMKFSSKPRAEEARENPKQPRFRMIDSLFGVPEACLYADIVEYRERRKAEGETLNYLSLYQEVRQAMDQAHATESIHNEIRANFSKYIIKDPEIGATLERLRVSGKQLFLLTNSDWGYTHEAMTYLLDGQVEPNRCWHDFFELVIVRSKKPRFFRSDEPFEKLDIQGQTIGTNRSIAGHKFWRGGNQKDLDLFLGEARDRVLYIGDHIFGDILRTKKSSAWRTMLVVEELERELLLLQEIKEQWNRWEALEERRSELNNSRNDLSVLLERLKQFESNPQSQITLQEKAHATAVERAQRQLQRVQQELDEVVATSTQLLEQIDQRFNPYWGMLFREGHQYSYLGEQVRSFACLYTSRMTNLLCYTPNQYFRPPLPLLPHEMSEERE